MARPMIVDVDSTVPVTQVSLKQADAVLPYGTTTSSATSNDRAAPLPHPIAPQPQPCSDGTTTAATAALKHIRTPAQISDSDLFMSATPFYAPRPDQDHDTNVSISAENGFSSSVSATNQYQLSINRACQDAVAFGMPVRSRHAAALQGVDAVARVSIGDNVPCGWSVDIVSAAAAAPSSTTPPTPAQNQPRR